MIRRLRCKRGIWPTGFLVAFIITVGIGSTGLYKTSKNGVLKNNGKKIWCKVQNKGENFCNEKYEFTPTAHHWEYQLPTYVEGET